VNPTACPVGHYCPAGTMAGQSNACPKGTFGPKEYFQSSDDCNSCTAGWYCEQDGLSAPTGTCWSGYYCTGGAESPTPVNHLVCVNKEVYRYLFTP